MLKSIQKLYKNAYRLLLQSYHLVKNAITAFIWGKQNTTKGSTEQPKRSDSPVSQKQLLTYNSPKQGIDFIVHGEFLVNHVPQNGILVLDFDETITKAHQYRNFCSTLDDTKTDATIDDYIKKLALFDITSCKDDDKELEWIMGDSSRQKAFVAMLETLVAKNVHIWVATFGHWPLACLAVIKQTCGDKWDNLQAHIHCDENTVRQDRYYCPPNKNLMLQYIASKHPNATGILLCDDSPTNTQKAALEGFTHTTICP